MRHIMNLIKIHSILRNKFLFCALLHLSLLACDSTKKSSKASNSLNGTSQNLEGNNFSVLNYKSKEGKISYHLLIDKGQAILKLDKNQCRGRYTLNKNEIVFTAPLMCTKICCDGKEGMALVGDLQGSFSIKKQGTTFILSHSTGKKIELQKVPLR